jgi:hypothetical protein
MTMIGAEVVDRRVRERAVVRCVTLVPPQHDLFGRVIPAHTRYVVVFDDGRWANDRTERDLKPAETASGAAAR